MTPQPHLLTPHLDEPVSGGDARLAALASAVALFVSLRTTWLKLRLDHCDPVVCGDPGTCDEALRSSLSTLATIPITILSAGLFTVTLALSLALVLRRGPLWPAARPLLGLTAGAAALVCAALAAHAFTRLGHTCLHCITLYLATLALLVAATRMDLARALRRWTAAMRAGSRPVLDATLLALTIGVLAVTTLTVAYRLGTGTTSCPQVAAPRPR